VSRLPQQAEPQPSKVPWRLAPLFLTCSKCGATLHIEHQSSKPMILYSDLNPPEIRDLSPERLVNELPMVFSDIGTYIGKVLGVEDGAKLRVVRSDVEECFLASRFVFFSSHAVVSSEPTTLLLMPTWFEELPQFVHQLSYYETRIQPLLTLLANQKISEASFTMLLGKYSQQFQRSEFQKIQFLKDVVESEIAKIRVALETLEAQKIVGEKSDEEFLLKESMLSQIKTYLELVVGRMTKVTNETVFLSRKIQELVRRGSLSPTTASETLGIVEAILMTDRKYQRAQVRRSG